MKYRQRRPLSLAARSNSIALDTVAVRAGRVRIAGSASKMSIVGIDVDAEADSLLGPFRGSGEASAPGDAKTPSAILVGRSSTRPHSCNQIDNLAFEMKALL